MDAGSVTTARTVMRPAHPVQRLTSTSKVRRKRVAQSTRAWGITSENHGFPTGNAILSKWPIARTEVIPLPNGGSDEQRSVVFAELASPFGKIPTFCTHLNWRLHHGHIRQLQVKALTAAVARLAPEEGFPAIVMGDFNAEADSDEIRYLRGLTGLGGECVYFADS